MKKIPFRYGPIVIDPMDPAFIVPNLELRDHEMREDILAAFQRKIDRFFRSVRVHAKLQVDMWSLRKRDDPLFMALMSHYSLGIQLMVLVFRDHLAVYQRNMMEFWTRYHATERDQIASCTDRFTRCSALLNRGGRREQIYKTDQAKIRKVLASYNSMLYNFEKSMEKTLFGPVDPDATSSE